MPTTDDTRLGSSVSCFTLNSDGVLDLDPSGTLIYGRQAVAEAVASRWSTPAGTLLTDLGGTLDLRMMLSAGIDGSEDSITGLRSVLTHVALRDERVKSIDIAITLTPSTGDLSIKAAIKTNDADTFEFVVSVTKLVVSIFSIDGAAGVSA